MSLTGKSIGNVSTDTTLTSNKIIIGNGSREITTSGITCDSSNNLITAVTGTTNMYDTVSYVFAEDSTSFPSYCEVGLRFTIASSIVVSAFRGYRTTTMPTTKAFTLWNSVGTLLATASTSGETVGAWTTSGALNTGALTLPTGSYTLSFTIPSIYAPRSTTGLIPITINGIAQTDVYFHITPGVYPATHWSGYTGLLGIDLVWASTQNFTLSPPSNIGASGKTVTFPGTTGTVALTSDLSAMVTQTSTNTSGNVMTGGGTRLIQDSLVPLSRLLLGGRLGYKVNTLYLVFDNSVFTTSNSAFNITSAGWGVPAAGRAKINVTGSYHSAAPLFVQVTPVSVGATLVGDFLGYYSPSISSATEIYINGTSTGGLSALTVQILIIGI